MRSSQIWDILKAETNDITDKLIKGYKGKVRVENDSKVWGLGNQMDKDPIY